MYASKSRSHRLLGRGVWADSNVSSSGGGRRAEDAGLPACAPLVKIWSLVRFSHEPGGVYGCAEHTHVANGVPTQKPTVLII